MSKQLVVSALALATLALNACSSEPSDWRPEAKVSVDMVEPGSRSSDNFDQHTPAAADQSKGGAIERPISSHADLEGVDHREGVSAEKARTADAEDAAQTNNPDATKSVKKAPVAPKAASDQKAEAAGPDKE
ncbi:hypothetical protein [Hymenobacter tenuis]